MQNKSRLELADYEAETLGKLKTLLVDKWTFVIMEANAQLLVTKLRQHKDKKILESQERAFWDVHRPVVIIIIFTYLTSYHNFFFTAWCCEYNRN